MRPDTEMMFVPKSACKVLQATAKADADGGSSVASSVSFSSAFGGGGASVASRAPSRGGAEREARLTHYYSSEAASLAGVSAAGSEGAAGGGGGGSPHAVLDDEALEALDDASLERALRTLASSNRRLEGSVRSWAGGGGYEVCARAPRRARTAAGGARDREGGAGKHDLCYGFDTLRDDIEALMLANASAPSDDSGKYMPEFLGGGEWSAAIEEHKPKKPAPKGRASKALRLTKLGQVGAQLVT